MKKAPEALCTGPKPLKQFLSHSAYENKDQLYVPHKLSPQSSFLIKTNVINRRFVKLVNRFRCSHKTLEFEPLASLDR